MALHPTTPKPCFTVLASGFGWHVQDLQRASEKVGVHLTTTLFQNLSIGIPPGHSPHQIIAAENHQLQQQDAVLVRMMPPAGLERVVFRMDVLHRLHESGIPVFNPPRTIEMAVDKTLSLSRLASHGVIVPETWAGESVDDALIAFDRMGGDVVIKPVFGSEGRGIIRLQSRELAWRVFHGLSQIGSVLYLQKFIENDGMDYRLMYCNGRIIAGMRRTAPQSEWRTNVAQGGIAENLNHIDSELKRIAIRTAEVSGGILLGIDIIQDKDGRFFVLEVNGVPGWRALAQVSGVDIAAEWLDAVRMQVGR